MTLIEGQDDSNCYQNVAFGGVYCRTKFERNLCVNV